MRQHYCEYVDLHIRLDLSDLNFIHTFFPSKIKIHEQEQKQVRERVHVRNREGGDRGEIRGNKQSLDIF